MKLTFDNPKSASFTMWFSNTNMLAHLTSLEDDIETISLTTKTIYALVMKKLCFQMSLMS